MARRDPEATRAYQAAYHAAHREAARANRAAHYAAHAEENRVKARVYHAAHREQARAYRAAYYVTHRAAILAQKAAYYSEHREQLYEYQRAYDAAHPEHVAVHTSRRRAAKRRAPVNDLTTAQWREIKEAFGHQCAYCHRKMQKLTQDHLTPLAKGGSHTASNVVPACTSCNSKKHTGPPLQPVQPLLLTLAPSKK